MNSPLPSAHCHLSSFLSTAGMEMLVADAGAAVATTAAAAATTASTAPVAIVFARIGGSFECGYQN
jgi:hypothetical protein